MFFDSIEPPSFDYKCQVINQSDNTLVIQCTSDARFNTSLSQVINANHLLLDKNTQEKKFLIYPPEVFICEVYLKKESILVSNVTGFKISSHSQFLGILINAIFYHTVNFSISFFFISIKQMTFQKKQ